MRTFLRETNCKLLVYDWLGSLKQHKSRIWRSLRVIWQHGCALTFFFFWFPPKSTCIVFTKVFGDLHHSHAGGKVWRRGRGGQMDKCWSTFFWGDFFFLRQWEEFSSAGLPSFYSSRLLIKPDMQRWAGCVRVLWNYAWHKNRLRDNLSDNPLKGRGSMLHACMQIQSVVSRQKLGLSKHLQLKAY